VGDVDGLDTAEKVYRYALDQAGVAHKGIKEVTALRALVQLAGRPTAADHTTYSAHDSADNVAVLERFPGLAAISHNG
jgi:hypothetical protein